MSGVSVRRDLTLALLLFVATLTPAVRAQALSIFSQLGLSGQEIAAIESGRAVAKVLAWGSPSEVYVFGAVHVNGSPSAYFEEARDVRQFTRRPGYLAAGAQRRHLLALE